ncbi:sigma-54 interaction domain-containing protein [Gimesia maris]|uniref:Transcriptional regulatory protein ZraR n=1 Tax=Gimesia maris TaxID=122 RepID=A0ABX5YNW0_9PLAN|nr:sigma 54-interacting transcriptional regulator [Gimesia maris]EDL62310.1 sigma 54-dependent transcriptional activator [Gimesia maris DSM 8797]QEG17293.1 Transcriptional regulatory protein ZraR [Gimesia maris]QGQ29610.1 AAA domain-containing protein [Gimesia maris]
MAAKRRILVQWIGHSDFRALATAASPARQKIIQDQLKGAPAEPGDLGPTKTLIQAQGFDEIRLLSTYDRQWNKWYQQWLGTSVNWIPVELHQPTDYARIFEIVDRELAEIKQSRDWSETELCLHLSPGTPAMSAVLLLLGKTRYPATFYETARDGRVWATDIPFDLIDVLPEVLRNPDAHLQHLASRAPAEIEGFEDIAGDSRAIREAVGRAQRAAIRNVSVLLVGESGTGKEMFAQAIHKASQRRHQELKTVNCAALSKSLLESELFGHCKGAFTGAEQARAGLFEAADGGTLFLDEIGECDLETQAKLLRVLQPVTGKGASVRRVCRLGENDERTVDVRIIAATNKDLFSAMEAGEFREDLYFRLAAISINLPPLRDRKSDIPKIAERLLGMLNRQFAAEEPGYQHKSLSGSAISFVKSQPWPGNVRQLYNALMQAAILSEGTEIGKKELAASIADFPGTKNGRNSILDRPLGDGFDLEEHLNEIHCRYLQRAMDEAHGVKAKAARLLGMGSYQTLDAQLKRLGVSQKTANESRAKSE